MTYQEVYSKILTLCTDVFSRHPASEVAASDKLRFYLSASRFDDVSQDIKDMVHTEVFNKLIDMKLIGDSAYVTCYIASNNHSSAPDGSMLIVKKLLSKGIAQEIIAQFNEIICATEVANASKLLLKKYGNDSLSIEKEKKLKYLYQRGYRVADVIYGLENA
jgi:SOS response regulatory protein OraA/RecX